MTDARTPTFHHRRFTDQDRTLLKVIMRFGGRTKDIAKHVQCSVPQARHFAYRNGYRFRGQ